MFHLKTILLLEPKQHALFLTPVDLGAKTVMYIMFIRLLADPHPQRDPLADLSPEPAFPAIPWYWQSL